MLSRSTSGIITLLCAVILAAALPTPVFALSCAQPPSFADAVSSAEIIVEVLPKKLVVTEETAFVWDTYVTQVYKGEVTLGSMLSVREQTWPSTMYTTSLYHENEPKLLFLRSDNSGAALHGLCDFHSRSLKERPLTAEEQNILAATRPAFVPSFPDAQNHPNRDAIAYVQEHGIVRGYDDGTFHPDDPMNRAEFTKIITLAFFPQEIIDQCASNYFFDVPSDAWYKSYVCRARDGWLLTGYPDGRFRPDAHISFVEAAKILANAFKLVQRETHCNGRLCPDNDTYDHPWYEKYVKALESKNAIPSSISRFNQTISRADMAEMIHRLHANIQTSSTTSYQFMWANKLCMDKTRIAGGTCE